MQFHLDVMSNKVAYFFRRECRGVNSVIGSLFVFFLPFVKDALDLVYVLPLGKICLLLPPSYSAFNYSRIGSQEYDKPVFLKIGDILIPQNSAAARVEYALVKVADRLYNFRLGFKQ